MQKRLLAFVLGIAVAVGASANSRAVKAFTVADEIGLAGFDDAYNPANPPEVSPDGRFVALPIAERGVLRTNLVEDELRVYSITGLRRALRLIHGGVPSPVLDLREATYKEGPIISGVRWLQDSSGLAFLLRDARGENRLAEVSLKARRVKMLSLKGQDVTAFGIHDQAHFAYTVLAPGSDVRLLDDPAWTFVAGTGIPIQYMLFSGKELLTRYKFIDGNENWLRSVLWTAEGARPHPVMSADTHGLIVLYPYSRLLALSPDGNRLCAAIPVPYVPQSWMRQYAPPDPKFPYRMRVGPQNLDATTDIGNVLATEYVTVDLGTGRVRPIDRAPTGAANGWLSLADPSWSKDGKSLLLPNTYKRPAGGRASASGPCDAIFYLSSRSLQCIAPVEAVGVWKSGPSGKSGYTYSLQFAPETSSVVVRGVKLFGSEGPRKEIFVKGAGGEWNLENRIVAASSKQSPLEIYVRQSLNQAPVVMMQERGSRTSRAIWDPNPQLKHTALAKAIVYRWKDSAGRVSTGGLYVPLNYAAGRRYPLVIQTHGFSAQEFRPSGLYSTAFAAQALAATGIVVLQMDYCRSLVSQDEAKCQMDEFDSAVRQLRAQGLIDSNRVGIIGFSRSVYWVLYALTHSSVPFAAASLTDGVDFGYWQYLAFVDNNRDSLAREARQVIGAKPFGDGLLSWFKRSPDFNIRDVHTPLLVNALGRPSLLYMWEPYAGLRYLGRPVDLVMLNADSHVLTEPAMRELSQGGSVDWFRFWLQGYESGRPVMAEEYRNWERLCDMQRAQEPSRPTFCVATSQRRHANSSVRPRGATGFPAAVFSVGRGADTSNEPLRPIGAATLRTVRSQ